MVSEIKELIKFVFDKTVKWTIRLYRLFIILFSLWFLNDTFHFLYSYRINNKLDQIQKITLLIADTTLNAKTRNNLIIERDYILNHKTTLDHFSSFLNSSPLKISLTRHKTLLNNSTKTAQTNKDVNTSVIKNYWLHFLFSNFFLIIIMIIVPIQYLKNNRQPFFTTAFAIIILWFFTYLFCLLIAYLFDFIPVLFSRPWINYIVDFILQSILIIIAGLIAKSIKNQKKSERTT